jgi:membrane protein implicated in regulation of membrane protease activity
MTLVIAILLAVFLLPWPWSGVAVVAAAVWEATSALAGIWYSRRGRPQVGAEALVGRSAEVVVACRPLGQVRLGGELWRARCDEGADAGERVRVRAVEGITLLVEPLPADAAARDRRS